MVKVKQLSLKKREIMNYDEASSIKGGLGAEQIWSGGCTDGCGGLTRTMLNCTKTNCTADCSTGICDTESFCTL